MSAYILRRLLALIPTLLFASIIVFVTVRLIPGRRHRPDAEPERHRRRPDEPRAADRRARPRPADPRAVPALGRRGRCAATSAARCGTTTPVTELLLPSGCRSPSSSACWRSLVALRCSHCRSASIRRCARTRWATTIARSFSILLLAVPSFWLGTHGDGVPVDLVGLVARARATSRFPDDPLQNLEQMIVPAIVLGAVAVGRHDAHDAHDDARGAAPGLHPHRAGPRACPSGWWCGATRCATR